MITIKQFCDIFSITRSTFYQWEKQGIVKPVRVGGVVRISDTQVKQLQSESKETENENSAKDNLKT